MKLIKIIGHPVLVISMFLLILISGEKFGGFYLLYILMGLPFGAAHSLLALAGIAIILTGYRVWREKSSIMKPVFYLVGNSLLVLALFTFFKMSKGYNDSTFQQIIPMITFFLSGLCVLCNIVFSFWLLLQSGRNKEHVELSS